MHSRSFLHRTASTPRSSVTHGGPEGHFPLGFANVRSDVPGEADDRPRNPLGFSAPEPQFVTELSFRRSAPAPRAVASHVPAPDPAAPAELGTGHASGWRPAPRTDEPDATAETATATEPTHEAPRAEVPSTGSPDEAKIPFYKRELTLRRRKPTQGDAPAEVEPVAEVVADGDEPGEELEPERTIGFAAPAQDESDEPELTEDEQPVADAHTEPEVEAEVVDEETDAPEALEELTDEEIEDAVTVEVEPVAEASDDDPAAEETHEVEPVALEDEQDDEVSVAAMLGLDEPTAAEAPAASTEPVPDDEPVVSTDDADPVAGDALDDVTAVTEKPRRTSLRARRGGTPAPKSTAPKGARGGRRVVGLKIGASQLAAAVVVRTNGQDQLVTLARTPLEPGIVVDGDVRDPEALRTALRTFFEENGLPRRDVRIGVASNRIGVRTVDIAGIDEQDKFDNAVRFKAHEVLPVSFSESVLDYRVVEERATENGDVTKRVLLVVAPKDQVEPFAAACVGAGLKLAGVDLEALGLLRAFVAPQAPGSRTSTDTATVVVAIGHESTTLLVSGGGTCEFTRVFDWGGLALQQAIAQELDVHADEATSILHGLSLSGPGRGSLDEEMRARALDAVRTRLTPFARELVSSLQFYQAQNGSLGIGEIVITGGTSHLEGLADALHQMIGVAVRVGDPLQRLVVEHALDPAVELLIGSFAVPVGLAIEDDATRGVNLLPDELRRSRRKKPSALQVALPIAAVVPLAAMGFLFMQANGDVSAKQSEIAAVQAQIDALPEPTRPDIDPTLAVDQQQRAAALATVLGSRLAWDRVLGDLSRVMPANVWLTRFTAQTPEPTVVPAAAATPAAPTVAPSPTGVTIEGYTYSVPDVAKLLARLGTVPSLTNVVLGSSEEREVGKRTAIAFTIIADIDGNGGAQ